MFNFYKINILFNYKQAIFVNKYYVNMLFWS